MKPRFDEREALCPLWWARKQPGGCGEVSAGNEASMRVDAIHKLLKCHQRMADGALIDSCTRFPLRRECWARFDDAERGKAVAEIRGDTDSVERPHHRHDRRWDRDHLPRTMTRDEYQKLNHWRRFVSIGARCGFRPKTEGRF